MRARIGMQSIRMLVLRAFSHTAICLFKVLLSIPVIQAIFQYYQLIVYRGKFSLCYSNLFTRLLPAFTH